MKDTKNNDKKQTKEEARKTKKQTISQLMGDSRKYPYTITGGMSILTPSWLWKFQNALPLIPSKFKMPF